MRSLTTRAVLTLAALTLAVACGSDGITDTGEEALGVGGGLSKGGGTADTTGSTPTTPTNPTPSDSTPSTLPEKVQASGRVIGVTVAIGEKDSLRFEPVAGASVTVHRNVLVDGKAQQVLVTTLTTKSDGSWSLADLAGGHYILTATPPAGSPYKQNWTYLPATTAVAKADVYLWK